MDQLSAIIIDDERPARRELAFLLEEFRDITVLGDADNISDSIKLINELKPDLVFLDIQLSGENGFDLLNQVCVDFKVIFVTAYDEYAIKAFNVNASDYLLKPVDPKRLKIALDRVWDKDKTEKPKASKFNYDDSIYLRQNNCTTRFVEINSITSITSVANHSRITTLDGNNYMILKTLKQWESELPSDFFIRIHRSSILNIKHITKIDNYSKTHHRAFVKQIETPFEISRNAYRNLKNTFK